jgi:hypothetical protein
MGADPSDLFHFAFFGQIEAKTGVLLAFYREGDVTSDNEV